MSYDTIAEGYDEFVRSSYIHQVAVPSLLSLCGAGEAVVDIACGQGAMTRALASRYSTVVGVDQSAELIRRAVSYEGAGSLPPGLSYVVDDATRLSTLADSTFDGATCCLATTDLDDIDAVLASAARVLRPGGWFVLTSLHPCFEPPYAATIEHEGAPAKAVRNYFAEGRWWPRNPESLMAEIGRYHRMLSTLLNAFGAAGFVFDRADEPVAPAHVVEASPAYGAISEVLTLAWHLPPA